ncbi:MAG: DUF308 domain-containing protein [Eubacterium sp.]|nr:DUF308 domain-containing protein [Eubacterium sp.]
MAKKSKEEPVVLEVAKKESATSTIVLLVASLLCIFTGVVLLYVPQINEIAIVYIYLAGIIIWGIVILVRYYQTSAYKKYHDYSFTSGAIAVILGCCGLVRAQAISQNIDGYVGLAVLVLGIIMLQNVISMKYTHNVLWPLELVLSLATVICSIIILTDFQLILSLADGLAYWMLVFTGAFSIISVPIVAFGIRHDRKKEERRFEVADMASKISLDDVSEPELIEENSEESAPGEYAEYDAFAEETEENLQEESKDDTSSPEENILND